MPGDACARAPLQPDQHPDEAVARAVDARLGRPGSGAKADE
jgi:hypothetical protein